jgi:nucleotide-binding universal stress UspA family protein
MVQKKSLMKRMGLKVTRPHMYGKTWVIAADPFSGLDQKPVLNFSRKLAAQVGAHLEAIYVLAPSSFNWTGDFSGPWFKRYRPYAENQLENIYGSQNVNYEVALCKSSSLRESARTLIRRAERMGAHLLITATHARHGLERLAMGSFAETLILMSDIPVLVVNPEHKFPPSIRRILIPTDLSKESRKFIRSLRGLVEHLDSEIVLLYKKPDPMDPIIQQGVYSLGGGWISAQSFLDEENDRNNEQLTKLTQDLRRQGLRVSSIVDSSPFSLIESVNQAAVDKNIDMIALVTHSGPWAAAILGSVARGLVRTATVPILIHR